MITKIISHLIGVFICLLISALNKDNQYMCAVFLGMAMVHLNRIHALIDKHDLEKMENEK